MHEQLQQSQQVAITAIAGMGGIGKTELALQYARRYAQQAYPGGVCWLEARDQDIATQILGFAQAKLELTPPDELPAKERIAHCWDNWPNFGDSPAAALVVIDDVSDYSAIEDYLPTHERFTLLLTTRQQRLATIVKPFSIEVLSEEAALELLRQLAEDAERIDAELEQAKTLCKWLGYLPLGLELVGRYLAIDLDLSLAQLQEQLDAQSLEAEALTDMEVGMTASLNLTKAIELSWQRLSSGAQDLAGLLGVFAPAPIPWPRVEACYPDVEPATLKRLRNLELLRFNLLQRIEQERYQLHPVIHRFIRTKLADDSPLIAAYCEVMVEAAQELEQTPTLAQIGVWREMVPHVAEAATQWVLRVKDEALAWPFIGLGRFYQGQGFYADAEVWRERCVTLTQARLGTEHPDVAMSLNNLANLYSDQGRYGEAEPLFLQAIDLGKASLGEAHPDVATRLNNLALLYSAQGRYEEAEPLYLQALEMTKASLGEAHPAVATSLNNLANLYQVQGRYGEAEPLFLQAIDLGKASLGEAHPAVAKR
ncbi:MAG: tetratricopeptide repeat protein, partial [Cyanobacteria bacterium P01_A01_bin.123]